MNNMPKIDEDVTNNDLVIDFNNNNRHPLSGLANNPNQLNGLVENNNHPLSGLAKNKNIEDHGDYVIEHTSLGPIKRKKYKVTENTIMTSLGPIEPANWTKEDLEYEESKYDKLFLNKNNIKEHIKDVKTFVKYIASDLKGLFHKK